MNHEISLRGFWPERQSPEAGQLPDLRALVSVAVQLDVRPQPAGIHVVNDPDGLAAELLSGLVPAVPVTLARSGSGVAQRYWRAQPDAGGTVTLADSAPDDLPTIDAGALAPGSAGLPAASAASRLLTVPAAGIDPRSGCWTAPGGATGPLTREIAELFYFAPRGLTVAEIAQRCERNLEATVRLAQDLVDIGLLVAWPASGMAARLHGWLATGHLSLPPAIDTLDRLWRRTVTLWGDRPAVVTLEGDEPTYAEMDVLVGALAAALQAAGLRKGDRLALWMAPSVLETALVQAAWRQGIVLLSLDPLAPAAGIALLVRRLGIVLLLGDAELLAELDDGELACNAMTVGVDDPAGLFGHPGPSDATMTRAPDLHGDDPAMLVPTSGTTADSKIVLLSHGTIARAARANGHAYDWGERERIAAPATIFNVGNLRCEVFVAVCRGGARILKPVAAPGHILRIWADAARLGATEIYATPAFWHASLRLHRDGRLPSVPTLRRLSSAGGPLRVGVRRELHAAFGVHVNISYGATELSSGLCVDRAPPETSGDVNRVGWASEGLVWLTDIDSPGGAIVARGRPHVLSDRAMLGYATADGFERSAFDGAWFTIQDIAVWEEDGSLLVLGRADDQFKLENGQLLDPEAVADILRRQPGVNDAAISRYVHPVRGAQAVAVVEAPVAEADLAVRLQKVILDTLGEAFVPFAILTTDALPRTATAKIARPALAEFVRTRLGGDAG
ncbi:MAG: AMP-binding protein [Pseudomonadota bacterium]|nr:AMP-binding protein [Pseudomonadota bacterium]